ncbi:MAG: sodium/proton-translocating pyrophosphatase [Acidilobus sp.]
MGSDIVIASIGAIVGVISVAIAVGLARWVLSQDPGPENVKFISDSIASGARAYLFRQFRTLSIVLVVLAIIIAVGISYTDHSYALGGSSAAA